MSTQELELQFCRGLRALIELTQASGVEDKEIIGFMGSELHNLRVRWKKEMDKRNAERINGTRPMNG